MTIHLYPLTPYMLTCDKCNSFTSQQDPIKRINKKKEAPKKNKDEDTLFWIFYYLLHIVSIHNVYIGIKEIK